MQENETNSWRNAEILLRESLADKERIVEKLRDQNDIVRSTISNLEGRIAERDKDIDKLNYKSKSEIRSKQEIINIMKSQLNTAQESNENLEKNLAAALQTKNLREKHEHPAENNLSLTADPNVDVIHQERPEVVILHDSLCKNINDSIMSKENVTVTKIWAPTLLDMENKIQEIENTDVIVIQALTRDLDQMVAEELTSKTFDIVEKCLEKVEKVVISSIVNREDDETKRAKADVINANLKLHYMSNPNVLVCHHENLRESRFPKHDKLHLTDYGTSRLANNLKFKIAESLGIEVVKKTRYHHNQYEHLNNRRNNNSRDNDREYYNNSGDFNRYDTNSW